LSTIKDSAEEIYKIDLIARQEVAALNRHEDKSEDAMKPSISVIVCTANKADDLSVCLKSLLRQQYTPTEIVVVDTDPDDAGTRLLLQRRFPNCVYVSEPTKSIAKARNRGLYQTTGEIIAYVDESCRPFAGWSRAIVRNFAQMPKLGCCTGPVLPLELRTRPQRLMEERGGYSKGFARSVFTRNSPLHLSGSHLPHGRSLGTGENMAFRRSVFGRVGGFDTSLRSAEDKEMFFRVVRADFELVYEPRAVVFHRHPRTYKELRRALHLLGHGQISSLLRIANTDPLYRKKALSEASSWFWSFQIRDRLCGRLMGKRRGFPLGLVLAEMAGGARAVAEHLIYPPVQESREEPGPAPRFFSPFIRILRRWT
jgi:glycosyltransferase involved in cell wall biosynthesis